MYVIVVLWVALWLAPQAGWAATIAATTCDQADITIAHTAAQDGDTITVPAGNCTWSTKVTITKGVILQGAGIGNTVITDNVPTSQFFELTTSAGKAYRVTGFEFVDGASSKSSSYGAWITGQSTAIRLDHLKFTSWDLGYLAVVRLDGGVMGVMDHCDFVTTTGYAIYVGHGSWKNIGLRGHNSWATTSGYGTGESFFIEQNTFTGSTSGMHVTDGAGGGRMVFRYNTVTNGIISWHGNDTSGWDRGYRLAEIYNNTFTNTAAGLGLLQIRSGTGVIHTNTINGYASMGNLNNYRSMGAGNFGRCDGTGPYDNNDPTGIFETGTHTPATFDAEVLTDGTKTWTTNEWVGYSLINTQAGGEYLNAYAVIESNTATTITTSEVINTGVDLKFNQNDTYEIRKADACIDQVGRGPGDLLTGEVNPTPIAAIDQVLEPLYMWSNTSDGISTNINSNHAHIQVNRDFYNNTARPGYTAYQYPHPLNVVGGSTTTETFTTAGTFTNGWTAPTGVTTVTACGIGGGGAGAQRSTSGTPHGGGGGGGASACKEIAVTPATAYTYVVGAAGTSSGTPTNGGASSFTGDGGVQMVAAGGTSAAANSGVGGAGGTTAASDGTTEFAGGAGRTTTGGDANAGGGGSSAGTSSIGTTATSATGASAVAGGGPGGNGATTNNTAGSAPVSGPGGGGGGGKKTSGGTTRLGGAGFAGRVTLTYIAALAAPTNLVATPGLGTVGLDWTAVGGATGYVVYRSPTVNTNYTELAYNVGTNSYDDNTVANGTLYYYKVTSLNGTVESLLSNEASATPDAPEVSLSPTSLTFGDQTVDTTSAAQTITLTNTGGFTLHITSIAISGTHASNFSFSGCGNGGSTTVAASANCAISVFFTPSASGARTGRLDITSDAETSVDMANVSGTGGDPPEVTASLLVGTRDKVAILQGQSVTLTWVTTDTDISCSIDQGVGTISPCSGGNTVVSPTVDTTYTLTAVGTTGSAQSSVTVHVSRGHGNGYSHGVPK